MVAGIPQIHLHISGQLLAMLLFEFVSNPHGIDGLLYGHNRLWSKQHIMDDGTLQTEHLDIGTSILPLYNTTLSVLSFIFLCVRLVTIVITAFVRPSTWYNTMGEMNTTKLDDIQHNRPGESILGYFTCRQRTKLIPSLRESTIHKNLQSYLSSTTTTATIASDYTLQPLDSLLLGLWSVSVDEGGSIWDWSYCMYRKGRREREFQRIALHVSSLIQSTSAPPISISQGECKVKANETAFDMALTAFNTTSVIDQLHTLFRTGYQQLKDLEEVIAVKEKQTQALLTRLDEMSISK